MVNIKRIQIKYEKIIIKSVLSHLKPNAIILYGGYGRNEGSWVLSELNEPQPYNDFDIALVYENKISVKINDAIIKSIKDKVKIKWVDLSQYRKLELKNLKNSILNYDFKYATKVIYGDEKIIDLIPDFKASKIPLKDIDILFKTRIWTLVGSIGEFGICDMSSEDAMFFRNQMAKCILAVVDCNLILEQGYHHSYKERVEIFKSYTVDKELKVLVDWALEEKLRPKQIFMSASEVSLLYKSVSEYFLKYFYIGLSKYYGCEIDSYPDVKKIYFYNSKNYFKRILVNFIRGNKTGDKRALIIVLQLLCVLYELNKDKKLLDEICVLSNKVGIMSHDFNSIRFEVAILRMKI